MHDERASLHPVFDPVPDGMETPVEAQPVDMGIHPDGSAGGSRGGRGADDAAVDGGVRDHLNRPARDWQKRPMPWEYTSKSKYKHDLEKFMEEVYGNGND